MRNIVRPLIALGLASAVLGSGLVQAQNAPGQGAAEHPTRGMTMTRVESTFGAPSNRVAPVGQPPITRWEYPGFIVYFENQHVIHTVAVR